MYLVFFNIGLSNKQDTYRRLRNQCILNAKAHSSCFRGRYHTALAVRPLLSCSWCPQGCAECGCHKNSTGGTPRESGTLGRVLIPEYSVHVLPLFPANSFLLWSIKSSTFKCDFMNMKYCSYIMNTELLCGCVVFNLRINPLWVERCFLPKGGWLESQGPRDLTLWMVVKGILDMTAHLRTNKSIWFWNNTYYVETLKRKQHS